MYYTINSPKNKWNPHFYGKLSFTRRFRAYHIAYLEALSTKSEALNKLVPSTTFRAGSEPIRLPLRLRSGLRLIQGKLCRMDPNLKWQKTANTCRRPAGFHRKASPRENIRILFVCACLGSIRPIRPCSGQASLRTSLGPIPGYCKKISFFELFIDRFLKVGY